MMADIIFELIALSVLGIAFQLVTLYLIWRRH
jgi:hypothetical protein